MAMFCDTEFEFTVGLALGLGWKITNTWIPCWLLSRRSTFLNRPPKADNSGQEENEIQRYD
jgi:hypothetical protein